MNVLSSDSTTGLLCAKEIEGRGREGGGGGREVERERERERERGTMYTRREEDIM